MFPSNPQGHLKLSTPRAPSPTTQTAPGSVSESATGAVFPPKRFPSARGARRAKYSPAAASRGPRPGAAAVDAWCRLALRLKSCAPSPASRASPLRGAGLRTPGTQRGASLPESESSAVQRGPGGRAGKGEGGRCLSGPRAPLLRGGLEGACGLQRHPGLRRPGIAVSAGAPAGRRRRLLGFGAGFPRKAA